jgi:tRNA (guanine37-N1)-methyltransferase
LIDKEYKLILLSQENSAKAPEDFPEPLTTLMKQYDCELTDYELTLTHKHCKLVDILKNVLPEKCTVPKSFEMVGTIAHVNLESCQLPYKHLIGEAIMLKNSQVRTVVNKTEKINNVYRNATLEVIAGANNFITTVKEGNSRFDFDYSKVYWNSNNHTDRENVISMIKPG